MDRYIKIILPTNGKDKWAITSGLGGHARKRTPLGTVKWLERLLSEAPKKTKTAVTVNYGLGATNETCPSLNPHYLLYTAYCFLEDYLPEITVAQKLKKYERNHENP